MPDEEPDIDPEVSELLSKIGASLSLEMLFVIIALFRLEALRSSSALVLFISVLKKPMKITMEKHMYPVMKHKKSV